eukprot:3907560-Karenia_brevis.AAC.1
MRPVDSGEGVAVHRPESEHLQCSHEEKKASKQGAESQQARRERERGVAPPSKERERLSAVKRE